MAALAPLPILVLTCFLACFASTSAAAYYTPAPWSTPYAPGTPKPILNAIDSCWRTKSNWAANRRALADCAVGFGKDAIGGKYGAIYVVTTPYDDAVNPKPGTLRYGVIQTQPLWIVFAKDMVIKLENELIMNSFKTIDGRGAKVEIAYGPCITVQGLSHVIIHGISIHDCKPGKSGLVRSSPTHVGRRGGSDGDGISVFASSNVWIDHCFLARCADGLIDVIHALQKKLFFATCSSPRVQSLYTWRTVARGHVNTRGGSM
jgi:pectate lyase